MITVTTRTKKQWWSKKDVEDEEEGNSNDEKEDDKGYTTSKRTYLNCIYNYEAASDDNYDNNHDINGKGKEEKDKAFYYREERALKRVEVIAKIRKHTEEAQSICHLARTAVAEAKKDTQKQRPYYTDAHRALLLLPKKFI